MKTCGVVGERQSRLRMRPRCGVRPLRYWSIIHKDARAFEARSRRRVLQCLQLFGYININLDVSTIKQNNVTRAAILHIYREQRGRREVNQH